MRTFDSTTFRLILGLENTLILQGPWLCMTFGDYGNFPNDWKKESAVDFSSATLRFIKALGISKKEALATIARLLNLSADYPEQIQALRSLPEEHKANLIGIYQRIRKQLENL